MDWLQVAIQVAAFLRHRRSVEAWAIRHHDALTKKIAAGEILSGEELVPEPPSVEQTAKELELLEDQVRSELTPDGLPEADAKVVAEFLESDEGKEYLQQLKILGAL